MSWFRNVYEIVLLVLFSILKLRAQDVIFVSRPPNETYVELGETLTLNVTYQSTKKVVITWTKDGSTLYSALFPDVNPRVSLKGQASLVLVNTTLLDNGTYELDARTVTFLKRITLNVIIQVKPTANISCSSYQLLNEGGHFECLCKSTGGNPPGIASWYRYAKEVSGPGYLKQTLSLKDISKENAGIYSCIVKSHDLRDSKQVEIQVQYKPGSIFFTNNQKENITSVGKSMRITCQADAFPEPNYIISHNGIQLSNDVDGVVIINSVNLSDAGRYECIANNFLGSASASFNLTVKVPPVAVTSCLSYVIVEEGRAFGCICHGKGGNSHPVASWYKVIDGSLYSRKSTFLKIVNREDAGNYSCIAKSDNLNDTKQVEIVVHYKPTITSFESDMNNVEVGKKVTITCKAVGFPPPNYTIFLNSVELSDVVDGVKTFKSVSLCDTGHYVCTAKNVVGGDSESVRLIVKVKSDEKDSDNTGINWKIVVITLICGICFGMIFLFAIQSLRQRMKNKKDNSENELNYEIPEIQQKETEDNSAYQELELQNKEPENSYQALRKTRRKVDNEIKIEDEAGYQELDKVRENNDNYQSLNQRTLHDEMIGALLHQYLVPRTLTNQP